MTQVIIKNDGVGERMPLSENELGLTNAYWRAANYLSVGQNLPPRQPAIARATEARARKAEAPRALGDHTGYQLRLHPHEPRDTELGPGRRLRDRPGPRRPAAVANAYLEGTYTEVYPHITRDEAGMAKLFRQFSFPGGIPSHVAPETPGSLHEGGELGYALSHAYGAAFDNPNLLVCCIVGDGEARRARWRRAGIPTSS